MSIHHTKQQPWIYPSLLPLCETWSLKLIFLITVTLVILSTSDVIIALIKTYDL